MKITGVMIDASINGNNWCVPPEYFEYLAKNAIGKVIKCDHANSVDAVKGIITATKVHKAEKGNIDAIPFDHIHFWGVLEIVDPNVLIPLTKGWVDGCSPTVDSIQLLCSKCGNPGFPPSCGCEDMHIILVPRGLSELSIVVNPAYPNCRFTIS